MQEIISFPTVGTIRHLGFFGSVLQPFRGLWGNMLHQCTKLQQNPTMHRRVIDNSTNVTWQFFCEGGEVTTV